MNLKRTKKGIKEGLEKGWERWKRCNYNLKKCF